MLGKEYLGEASVLVDDWFKEGVVGFDDTRNVVCLPVDGLYQYHSASDVLRTATADIPQRHLNKNENQSLRVYTN